MSEFINGRIYVLLKITIKKDIDREYSCLKTDIKRYFPLIVKINDLIKQGKIKNFILNIRSNMNL